jgi:hypothetical protein
MGWFRNLDALLDIGAATSRFPFLARNVVGFYQLLHACRKRFARILGDGVLTKPLLEQRTAQSR